VKKRVEKTHHLFVFGRHVLGVQQKFFLISASRAHSIPWTARRRPFFRGNDDA